MSRPPSGSSRAGKSGKSASSKQSGGTPPSGRQSRSASQVDSDWLVGEPELKKTPSRRGTTKHTKQNEEAPKLTGSEAVLQGRGARQFFISTNHTRQRQALFDGCNDQVGSLYGINEDYFDPLLSVQKRMKTRIEVPVIEKVTGVLCGGIRLCGPECMPSCPPDTLGRPLEMDGAWFKAECCRKSLPGYNSRDISTCTDTDSAAPSKGGKMGLAKKRGKGRDSDTMSVGGKSTKSAKSTKSGKSAKSAKSAKSSKKQPSDASNTFDEETKTIKLKKNKN